MALKVGNEWKEHGWWIKVDATQKPVLWITSYTVVEGRYWSIVGKSFGEISTISPSGSDDVLVTVSAEKTSPSKIRLQRRLLFVPIPRTCLEGEIVIRGLRSLQELWLTMPLEVRSAREIAVDKFSGLSPEEVRRATMLYLEHSPYDDLRSRDATTSKEQRPSEPEYLDRRTYESFTLWWNGGSFFAMRHYDRKYKQDQHESELLRSPGPDYEARKRLVLYRKKRAHLAWALMNIMAAVSVEDVLHNDLSPNNVLLHFPINDDNVVNIEVCDWYGKPNDTQLE
jgi:hypothetical protein